jgi:hypothetical protein
MLKAYYIKMGLKVNFLLEGHNKLIAKVESNKHIEF